ncbi:MAG: single-stranded DNA-binding protein [Bacilli bacterium]|nr:single-stranded DNA-binding protein [Bacilli bacterium]
MINRVVIAGRLTRDPELRNTQTGTPVATFTVAVDNRTKNPDGTRSASFIPVVVFAQAAETVSKFARKGMLVGVDGRLNQRSYDRKDGTKATVIEVIADSVQFLEPKAANGEDVETPVFDDTARESESSNVDTLELPDDDLPF